MQEDDPHASQRIVIIGGGCSGTLTAAQILLRASAGTTVVLVERTPVLGRGVAYGSECPEHLLNVVAARMSAFPEDPEHFLRWVRALPDREGHPKRVSGDAFLPRKVYGQYLNEVLQEARARAAPGVALETVFGEAVNLEESNTGPRITLADGRQLGATSVVLALGILPGEYPIRRSLPFYRSPEYVHLPYAPGATRGIGGDDSLLIVGAGLTAVDIAVQFEVSNHRGVIHALSRRGLRPLAHLPEPGTHAQFLVPAALPSTLRETLHRIRAEVRAGGEWRAVVDSVRPVAQLLWRGYSLDDQRRFMRHLRPFWEAHRHRIAPQTAAIVRRMEAAGRLKFHAGRLVSLRNAANGAVALIKLRGKEDYLTLRAAKVINCTGPRTDYSKYQHPLLINLLASGLIGHDPLALGIDALPSGEVLRYGGAPSGWLYTIGAPLKGVLWESTAVAEIRVQARNIAERLVSRMAVLAAE